MSSGRDDSHLTVGGEWSGWKENGISWASVVMTDGATKTYL